MKTTAPKPYLPWLILVSRSLLFICFQALIALLLALTGRSPAWGESVRWWTVVVILTNLVSIYLLVRLFKAEGKRYLDILRFSRATYKGDLLWFFGSGLIGIPIAAAPVNYLAGFIFGDSMVPINMMFLPLPAWGMVFSIFFPLTIAFSELPTYFGYVMPRLADQTKNSWLAWGLASLFLALQHVFLPFIFDGRFILWRVGMYLPFALFAGLLLKLRPSLLPYFVIFHVLIDFLTLSTYLMV